MSPAMTLPEAVLFDMDGTLVDTERLWWEVTEAVGTALGHTLGPADTPHVVGRAVQDTAAHLADVTGAALAEDLAATLEEAFLRRVRAGAPLRPGAARLLAALTTHGIPFALVSASPRSVVDTVVAGALAQVPFAFTLSADDTARTKPHPDPYEAAAARLGIITARCVAVEDSPDGAASADAAGCAVLVVPSLIPVPPSPRRTFLSCLTDVDVATLGRITDTALPDPGVSRKRPCLTFGGDGAS
ncbi:HAD family phosphatase [Streptomyces sp. NPDC093707]|uniref:HAD family hydrolase n=1 Tax=Streptomyces sp. NPDC093707 TaxID=3154984 RepID=UPI00345055AE